MKYERANLKDIVFVQEPVKAEVKDGIILRRSDEQAAINIRSYILAKKNDKFAGFGDLSFHAPTLAQVRSLVVDKFLHGNGIRKNIVLKLIREIEKCGVKELFALAYEQGFLRSWVLKLSAKNIYHHMRFGRIV